MKNVYNLSRPTANQHGSQNHAAKPAGMPQATNSMQKDWKLPSRYEVRNPIGTGSYGYVCEAWDRQEKRPVAIKKINRVFEDLVDCKRILREIALLNRMDHNNIVKILDLVCPEDPSKFDDIYLVLEIADSDFKKLCRTPVFLTELHIKTLLYNLLVGLKYLHSAGIYHRDLKPANCLVNQDCTVKICDFGLARTVNIEPHLPTEEASCPDTGTTSESASTTTGENASKSADTKPPASHHAQQLTTHVVTRWYRAPELILLQDHYTAAIDTWSVGCIFAELMNMIEQNCPHPGERGPLFPGISCFPLSPDQKHAADYKFHTRGNRDQLSVIFNVIGTPSDEDIEMLEKEDARRYVRIFTERPGTDLANRFPASTPESIDLLKRMLVFNASKRITVDEALAHPFFKNVRVPASEKTAAAKITVPFDDWTPMTKEELRFSFLKETQRFHPELVIPEHLELAGYGKK